MNTLFQRLVLSSGKEQGGKGHTYLVWPIKQG